MAEPALITTRTEALAFLDARIGRGVRPGLERIAGLLALMGDPHRTIPVIHVAGTNGKTTVVRMVADLLLAHGLRAATFTSPHLHRLEERFTVDGRRLDADGLVRAVADIAPFVDRFERDHGTTITYFELTTAAAFAAFHAAASDVAVVEVGLGGRLDATNVVEADVCALTGVAIDHTAYLGTSIGEIATEKAAILGPGGRLVTGPLPAAAEGPVTARVAEGDARWFRFGEHFEVASAEQAVGGWLVDVDGIHDGYRELMLPLHGRHQVDHLATSLAIVETFLDRSLDPEAVAEAATAATAPGRIEVVGRTPLVIVDGAHNEQGISGLAATLETEFPPARRILVAGFRGERQPDELLAPLADLFEEAVITEPADPLAIPAAEVAEHARRVLGEGTAVETVTPVAQAVTEALHRCGPDDVVVITGSLYVAGEARRRFTEDP